MNRHPIVATKTFQESIITAVNDALNQGVMAQQLADFLEHVALRQLKELAQAQYNADLEAMEKEGDADDAG